MAELTEKTRDTRLDILRILAFFCVAGTHFFLNSGYMDEIVAGPRMFVMTVARSFFVVCVPLFIILTGYLMNRKTVSKKYFFGIRKVLITYLICSVIYHLYLKFYLGQSVTPGSFLRNLLGYHGTNYAWYIELYIGLYLLIPFLNLAFNNLKSKRHAQLLLLVLFILTGLPSFFNVFSFESVEMWTHPTLITSYFKIFPGWWDKLWPLFCYFLGCYLKKYPLRINLGLHVFLLAAVCVADGAFNFYKSHGVKFIGASWNYNSAATVLIISLLLFSLLLRIRPKGTNRHVNGALKAASDAVLCAYLISCIFDQIIYAKLAEAVPVIRDRFVYAPLTVIAVFIVSLAAAMLINFIRALIVKGIGAVFCKQKKKEAR